ncbi:nucleotidyltransferase family protein [Haloplanus rubicundus]|uniref:Nucleotidyltransferase family protein n=1 Tax=Haloplanus rubicundus TaxID=1547898 RepID=A0A345ECF3_9EURY|nr:nucleotidyltransferase family protein [Haloplanus rubicundus]AXG09875.1 nucleotidyltransferase family protein [Haloplanus rubicundus]
MSLPVVSPPFDAPDESPSVAGVLLAAGTSDRYGERNKLLETHDGDPLVRGAARTLLAAPVDPVIVVVGHEADRVAAALNGLDVELVQNDAYATGQASSVREGMRAVPDRADAAVVALGDMPFVAPATVGRLVDAYAAGAGDALAAAHDGHRGNPVCFDRRFFDALTDVTGDVGGRSILLDHGVLVDTGDPGVRRDVDEPSDL